jgi:hypothetical protein
MAEVATPAGGQSICYPVLNEEYATKIARDWNIGSPARAM